MGSQEILESQGETTNREKYQEQFVSRSTGSRVKHTIWNIISMPPLSDKSIESVASQATCKVINFNRVDDRVTQYFVDKKAITRALKRSL